SIIPAAANRRFSRGSRTRITLFHISVGLSMPANVGWKSKAGEYRQPTGFSSCKSSPRAAFDERRHALPLKVMECEIFVACLTGHVNKALSVSKNGGFTQGVGQAARVRGPWA